MKVVHICLTGGYTEGFFYQENYLIKYQARMGHDVTLITTRYCWEKGKWVQCQEPDYRNRDNVEIIRIPYKYKIPYKLNTYIGRYAGLYDALERLNPEFIFVHNCQFLYMDQIAKYKQKHREVRVVVDNHADFSNSARNWVSLNILYKIYWRRNAKKIKDYAERFYGVLPARVDWLTDIYGLPKEKCELLVMGADDDVVEQARSEQSRCSFRKKHGIQADDFLIVSGGKIDSFKRQTLLLMEAVHGIQNDKLKLIIFGSVQEDIKQKFEALCDGKKVQYIGWAKGDQSYEFMGAADLIVFPGRHSVYWEQAAGLGIPMLCKYWKGTTHVDLGGNVLFLKEDSVEEIQSKIQRILDNPEEYEHMLNIAQERGKDAFSYREIARKSLQI